MEQSSTDNTKSEALFKEIYLNGKAAFFRKHSNGNFYYLNVEKAWDGWNAAYNYFNKPSFDLDAWFNETTYPTLGKNNKDLLCYLVYTNGGFKVDSFGVIEERNTVTHSLGLEQNEALILIKFHGFIEGLEKAGIDFYTPFQVVYDEYLKQL